MSTGKDNEMTEAESSFIQADLKAAAFRHLLRGPHSFIKFSARFGVSLGDIRNWLGVALENLESLTGEARKKGLTSSQTLTHEERRTLLEGKLPHEY